MPKVDGSVIIDTNIDVSQAEKDLAKLKGEIKKTEAEIEEMEVSRNSAKEKSVFSADELFKEELKLEEMKKTLQDIQAAAKDISLSLPARSEAQTDALAQQEEIKKQQSRVNALRSEYNKVHGAVKRYDEQLESARRKLELQQEEAGALLRDINSVSKSARKMAEAHRRAEKNMRRFALRLREVMRSALVFTLISQGLAKFREWMGQVIKTNDEATVAIANLKGALLTLAQPLVEVLIPAFTSLVNILTSVIVILARLAAAASGVTFEAAKDAAEALEQERAAIEGVGDAAAAAAKQLAPFDEINQLSEESASDVTDEIKANFDSLSLDGLPEWLKDLVYDLEVKIGEIRFSYDEGKLLQNADAWSTTLSAILGTVIGGMFGGLKGSVVGLLLGAAVGLISCTFEDKIGNGEPAGKIFGTVLAAILGAVIGAKFGGLTGAIIGLLLGATVSIISIEFAQGSLSDWDKNDTITVVLSAILGAVLGAAFGGFAGGVIGLLLGASISFTLVHFSQEGSYNKQEAIATLRVALLAILGLVLGSMFGGFIGGVVGLLLGLTIGFTTVAFDEEISATTRTAAKKALTVAITTIIGALIGAVFGGGVFGGIAGGVIGLTFGLAINFTVDSFGTLKDKIPNFTGIGPDYSWMFSGSTSVPGLATGAVVPPNREFLAVLGDNKTETEVVSPLSTMKQAFLEAMQESGGMGGDIRVELLLDGKKLAVNQVKHINDMTKQAGKSVLLV